MHEAHYHNMALIGEELNNQIQNHEPRIEKRIQTQGMR